jgi:phytanoyl-CoA hydroxylase
MTSFSFPEIDARSLESISLEHADFFRDHGVLLLKNVLEPGELSALRSESLELVNRLTESKVTHPDFFYTTHEITGETVPFRIDYTLDKMQSARVLLGHPFILRSIEKLQGASFIPTWDSKVFKAAGAGAAVNWHRDAGPILPDLPPIVFVDFYLDDADLSTALRAIPGSHLWSREQALNRISQLNTARLFDPDDAVALPMRAGDALFHNIHTLHGSPPGVGAMRRVVYFAFRSIPLERIASPSMPRYIPSKQKLLLACLRHRRHAAYVSDRNAFTYQPDPEWPPPPLDENTELPTYRIPHIEL